MADLALVAEEPGERFCGFCDTMQPTENWPRYISGNLANRCHRCWRAHRNAYQTPEKSRDAHLRWKYGITLDQERQMIADQENRCAVCGVDGHDAPTGRLHLDHDHKTGQVRKMLCQRCNTALGLVDEDETTLVSLLNYLREHAE